MRKAHIVSGFALMLMLAGCGGAQNPWRVNSGPTPSVFNGFWDGLLVIPVFIKDATGPGGWALWVSGARLFYWLGWSIGLVVALAALTILVRSAQYQSRRVTGAIREEWRLRRYYRY